VSGSHDNTVRVWDLDTGACLRVLEGHTDWVNSAALHADGRRVVTGSSDNTVRVWDLDTGACLRVLEGHTSSVRSVALHADGRRAVTGSHDNTVRVWDLDTGACVGTWFGASPFHSLDSDRHLDRGRASIVVGCEDGTVHLFELMPPGPLTRAMVATWSPTLPLVVTAVDSGAITLHQWHAASARLEEVARTEPTGNTASSLRFSLDGTRLQVRNADSTEQILEAATLQPAAPVRIESTAQQNKGFWNRMRNLVALPTTPTRAWAKPSDTSPDGLWRAEIVNGRLKIVPATFPRASACPRPML
jgi:WD40 repeat protein